MTALRQQAVRLVQQIPEDQVPGIIQYLHSLIGGGGFDCTLDSEARVSPKLNALEELEKMVRPVPGLNYKKELEEARDEKYG